MYYIKNFNTESEYSEFKNGEDWLIPNVSSINESSEIIYSGIPKKFHIGNMVDYDFEYYDGMTWEDWINSISKDFSDDWEFIITDENYIYHSFLSDFGHISMSGYIYVDDEINHTNVMVLSTDIISNENVYNLYMS